MTRSHELDARSRKSHSLILQRLASVGQGAVALALEVDESTVSRMKDGQLERLALLLTALGLKPVPIDARCIDAETYRVLTKLASERLRLSDEQDTALHWE